MAINNFNLLAELEQIRESQAENIAAIEAIQKDTAGKSDDFDSIKKRGDKILEAIEEIIKDIRFSNSDL